MPGPAKGHGGRPRKPVEQKRRTGNPGGRALSSGVELALVEPLEPTLADYPAVEALDRVMRAGVVWLGSTDAMALSLLRESLEERNELKAAVDQGLGSRRDLRELDKQIVSLLSNLGFDPAARARLALSEVKAGSKMEGIRASQEKRMAAKVVKPNHANGENAG